MDIGVRGEGNPSFPGATAKVFDIVRIVGQHVLVPHDPHPCSSESLRDADAD